MDPLTQGVLGATLPQALSRRQQNMALAGILGFFAGMAADLDVLIRSPSDPLLFLEYHRQFTHSLIFIPLGGLVCAAAMHRLFGQRRGADFLSSWLFCTLGYATHALLDACTTYGTMLLWPFSEARVAWNVISVIDPLFTLPLVFALIFSVRHRTQWIPRLAMMWVFAYPMTGMLQRDRAEAAGWALAASRGHEPVRLEAKPSFGNILLWKVVYETADKYYIDAFRTGTQTILFPGDSVYKLEVDRDMPWLDPNSQQAVDLERFRWFSNGYIARDPMHHNRVIDIRYSMIPNRIDALWSIEFSPDADATDHVTYLTSRNTSEQTMATFRAMLFP